jgi:LacI family transcriptional regulator
MGPSSPAGVDPVARRGGRATGTGQNANWSTFEAVKSCGSAPLNHPQRVAVPTRERVLAAVERLGFVRNEPARHLRARSSRVIGLIVLDASNPFEGGVAAGVTDAAEAAGYVVMLGSSAGRLDRERRYVELFEEQRVRGLIITPTHLAPANLEGLSRRGSPVVLLDGHPDAPHSNVATDDRAGARMAVEHLLSLGHSRLALVGGPWTLAQMQDRLAGAEEAILGAGNDATRVTTPRLTMPAGLAAADEILAMDPRLRPTAVFAANDLVAFGLLQRLLAAGLGVPDDVAIIGFDDIEFAAAAAVPLSSVRLPREELGRCAAQLLLEHVEALEAGREVRPRRVHFQPEL